MKTNICYQGDCLEVMKNIPNNSIDVIVTSPPYNKGHWSKNRNMNNGFKSFNHKNSTTIKTKSRRITYGEFDDNLSPEDYEKQQRDFIAECLRILKPTGSLFYNHIDILSRHQTIHPKYIYDFPLKQIIIWNRKNTPKLDKSYFFPITEYIYWIQKTKIARTFFNRKLSKFNSNVWNIPPDTKNKFPAPFPIDIVDNCINTCCPENGTVLDPFAGSGTTGLSAKNLNRNFILIEREKEYCDIIKERVGCEVIHNIKNVIQEVENEVIPVVKEKPIDIQKPKNNIQEKEEVDICECGGKIKKIASGRCCENCMKSY